MRLASIATGLLTAVLVLAGCSSMPSWTKPSVWYDQVVSDPEAVQKAVQEDATKKRAEPAGEFPSLANTPAPPAPGITEAQQREIRESLASDRDRTKAAVSAVKAVETPETRAAKAKAARGP
jgi:hypothetical protein